VALATLVGIANRVLDSQADNPVQDRESDGPEDQGSDLVWVELGHDRKSMRAVKPSSCALTSKKHRLTFHEEM
jgi:hypothetical protein